MEMKYWKATGGGDVLGDVAYTDYRWRWSGTNGEVYL